MRSAFREIAREIGLPLVLLAAGAVTTTAAGARFVQNFVERMPAGVRDEDLWPWPWLAVHPQLFWAGVAFSGPLLAILLIHEFGHYFACRWHGIRATLPFVLPAPTLSGTAGAVIRIKGWISNRNALMDVGIYGPLAGFAASALALVAGFVLSSTPARGAAGVVIHFGTEPLALRAVHGLVALWIPALPTFRHGSPHPMLLAGWIGLFITSLNLIPGGQLDGGHILYAISPRVHRFLTRLLPFVLFLMGAVYWAGWMLWGVILLLPAMRHPAVPAYPDLSRGRRILGWIGLAIFVLTFTPTPFYGNSLMAFFRGR